MKSTYLARCLLILAAAPALWAETVTAFCFSVLNEPKYQEGFAHFDYVNPDAPKGGSIRLAASGAYDNFHRYALRGHSSAGTEYFYDTLMTASEDEIGVYYPLVAEKIEYERDFSSFTVHIDPRARDQDGQPLTAEDAAFSFNILYTKGVPQFRVYYEGVKVTVLDRYRARFDLPRAGDIDSVAGLLSLPVFPKRFWVDAAGREKHDFSEPLAQPPLGSGPYRVTGYAMGQYAVLSRVPDYWARDLPARKGSANFDTIRYDYYHDESVAFEAFKAGEYDFRQENSARRWAEDYTGKLFDSGRIVRAEVAHEIPQPMQGFTFNTQRALFADRRVREALGAFLDFEWMNKNLFYSQYTRTRSYFENTVYEARGLPDAAERAALDPIRDKIPPEVFTAQFDPPVNPGDGGIRANARKAVALLREAGWELRGGKMLDRSGVQMAFELLIYDTGSERAAIPVQRNMAKYGIEMRIRMIDSSQYTNRLRSRDFDMITWLFGPYDYPSPDLLIQWHSAYIDHTWNAAGVMDEAVDYLTQGIANHQGDRAALTAWGRALDRVLTWNHFTIPQWHSSSFRIAYANTFAFPPVRPKYTIGLDTWWAAP